MGAVVRGEKTYRTQTSTCAVLKTDFGTTKSQMKACSGVQHREPRGAKGGRMGRCGYQDLSGRWTWSLQ